MASEVDDLLSGEWRAREAHTRKILQYISLTLADQLTHVAQKHPERASMCDSHPVATALYLVERLLDEPKHTEMMRKAFSLHYGPEALRAVERTFEKLFR